MPISCGDQVMCCRILHRLANSFIVIDTKYEAISETIIFGVPNCDLHSISGDASTQPFGGRAGDVFGMV